MSKRSVCTWSRRVIHYVWSGEVPHIEHFKGHGWPLSQCPDPLQLCTLSTVLYVHTLWPPLSLTSYCWQMHEHFTHSVDEYCNGTSFSSSCKIMIRFSGQYSEMLMDPYLVFVLRQISSLSGSTCKATSPIGRLQPLQWAALYWFCTSKTLLVCVYTTWISYISVSPMTVPGRTSHRPLSLKPSSLVQNKERVHYLLFPNFM